VPSDYAALLIENLIAYAVRLSPEQRARAAGMLLQSSGITSDTAKAFLAGLGYDAAQELSELLPIASGAVWQSEDSAAMPAHPSTRTT